MHCSSLGEFEQGRPVFEELKKKLENYIFVLSFYSPSGYERLKNNTKIADYILYLPIDLPGPVNDFLDKINPEICIFVKYDFWFNFIKEINKRRIKLIFISVLLNKDHSLFSFFNKYLLNEMVKTTRIFSQDEMTLNFLKQKGFKNVEIAGDTRIDRVMEISSGEFRDAIIEKFISDAKKVLVCGSTWEKDIEVLSGIQNILTENYKLIIAPHEISNKQTDLIKTKFSLYKITYYSKPDNETRNSHILIIDKIGILSRIYRYASLAYIGGGFGNGIHNTLEPASYSIPVIFGPKYSKFIEASVLVKKKAFFSINNISKLREVLSGLDNQINYTNAQNEINSFFEHNKDASVKIVKYIEKLSNEK
jgi:3-deoxy-D-manno-octulosonic-acid transferase